MSQSASSHLQVASMLHPAEFHVEDWVKYKGSYLGDPEFRMWEFLAYEFEIPDFAKGLDEAFKLVQVNLIR